ncbi:hypothetical protein FNF27_02552 [Cafeteria roenbergensis]|uniref:Uncharacterized protein n=1 Tax=Cafeteria roenbergensis TaxID=33653 RepID=A0A5A8EJ59_CAFRO|nr:hypothetical protein FNF27_02552 [Cafeteria roenbergensis]
MADIVAATKSGDASAVRAAIAAGEFVNAKDGRGWSLVHIAAVTGAVDVLRVLLSEKANAEATGPAGVTPLMAACKAAKPHVVEFLLTQDDSGADAPAIDTADQFDDAGMSAADYATQAMEKHDHALKCLEHIVAADVDLKAANKHGRTPLMFACASGNAQAAAAILALGAEGCGLAEADSDGNTATFMAAASGSVDCLKAIAESGADMAVTGSIDGVSDIPLLLAAALGGHDAAVVHLASLPGVDVDCSDAAGRTAAWAVARFCDPTTLGSLVCHGANLAVVVGGAAAKTEDTTDFAMSSPLMAACVRPGGQAMVEAIVRTRAFGTAAVSAPSGGLPLSVLTPAALRGDTAQIDVLVSAGACLLAETVADVGATPGCSSAGLAAVLAKSPNDSLFRTVRRAGMVMTGKAHAASFRWNTHASADITPLVALAVGGHHADIRAILTSRTEGVSKEALDFNLGELFRMAAEVPETAHRAANPAMLLDALTQAGVRDPNAPTGCCAVC